jgi:hypothetical protein
MLYIIGVSHSVQSRKPDLEKTDGQKAFANLLERTIGDVHPTLVAEEESEENLSKHEKMSIAQEVSHSTGIEHRFCDPSQVDRRAMGYLSQDDILSRHKYLLGSNLPFEEASLKASAIEMAQHFPKREQFWLDRLNGCREQDAIFICGDGHVESFTGLLKIKDIPYEIVERGFGMSEADHERVRKVVQYLEARPELRNG